MEGEGRIPIPVEVPRNINPRFDRFEHPAPKFGEFPSVSYLPMDTNNTHVKAMETDIAALKRYNNTQETNIADCRAAILPLTRELRELQINLAVRDDKHHRTYIRGFRHAVLASVGSVTVLAASLFVGWRWGPGLCQAAWKTAGSMAMGMGVQTLSFWNVATSLLGSVRLSFANLF